MRVTMIVFLLMLTWPSPKVVAQDYSVTDIDCQYGGEAETGIISARLRKPQGFQGVPIFADDRTIDPETSEVCSIRRNKNDVTGSDELIVSGIYRMPIYRTFSYIE